MEGPPSAADVVAELKGRKGEEGRAEEEEEKEGEEEAVKEKGAAAFGVGLELVVGTSGCDCESSIVSPSEASMVRSG